MEAEIRDAWMKAGLKMGLGFFVVAAALGIRIVSVEPLDGSSMIAPDAPVTDARPIDRVGIPDDGKVADEGGSSMRKVMSGPSEQLPGSTSAESRLGDRMVSCRTRGATQFMTADDCAMRGGSSTVFDTDR